MGMLPLAWGFGAHGLRFFGLYIGLYRLITPNNGEETRKEHGHFNGIRGCTEFRIQGRGGGFLD